MAKSKKGRKVQEQPPQLKVEEPTPEVPVLPTPTVLEKTISGAEAVRRTLAEGIEKPIEAVAHMKEKYGVDMKPQVFSSYKSTEQKRAAGGQNPVSSRPGRPRTYTRPAAPIGGSSPAEAAESVRDLVERYGPDEVKKLADLFSR